MTMTSIVGIGTVPINSAEYVSPAVLSAYSEIVFTIKTLFNKRPSNPDLADGANTVTAQDYDQLIATLQQFSDLARNGRIDQSGSLEIQGLINSEMAGRMNELLRMMNLFNLSPQSPTNISSDDKISALLNWQSLAGFGGEVLVNNAFDLAVELQIATDHRTGGTVSLSYTRTFQSMMELEYVKRGNDIIFENLTDLEQALNVTNSILGILQTVQIISNQIQSPMLTPFQMPSRGDLSIEEYKNLYQRLASAHFSQLIPIADPTDTAGDELLHCKRDLSTYVTFLSQYTTDTGNSQKTIRTAGDLVTSLRNVIQDISAAFQNVDLTSASAVRSAVAQWITDNQNLLISEQGNQRGAGAIQDRIASAIRSSETLNESQREDVRRYMTIFEEFYKSASAMLILLGQIFDKISGGIGNTK